MRQLTGRLRAARGALSRAEWARLSGMTLFILALNMLGWGIFAFAIQPHHFRYTGPSAPGTPSTPTTSPPSTTRPAN